MVANTYGRHRWAVTAAVLATAVLATVGCASSHRELPYLPGGEIQRTHPKPMEGGFYKNFDPKAQSIDISPVEDTNPVKTQHVLVATVRDKNGKPLPNRRVHWILSRGGVGDIVDVDASGWLNSRGHVVTNTFAETHTNRFGHVLSRGTPDTSDDVHLRPGQTWITITSPIEGSTHITAYAPGIYNWDKHKAFAVKHWIDAAYAFPPAACNAANAPHALVTTVTKASDGSPQVGWTVRYKIRPGGPPATFPNGAMTADVRTGADGKATVVLSQKSAFQAGATVVDIDVLKPTWDKCCKNLVLTKIRTGQATKQWDLPRLAITKSGPPSAVVCQEVCQYTISVRNDARCADAQGVAVVDTIPPQMSYVGSTPAGNVAGNHVTWSLGTLKPGQSSSIQLRLKPRARGNAVNTATATAALAASVTAQAATLVTQPQLALAKRVDTPVVYLGDTARFVITVKNAGDGPSPAVKLIDTFDKRGLEAIQNPAATKFAADIPALAAGQSSGAVVVDLKTTAVGQFTNTATIPQVACGKPLTATATVKVVRAALKVTKTGPTWTYLGKNVPFTITVSNPQSGPYATAATNVVLVDTPPAGMSFVNASEGGAYDGRTVTWNVGTLQPGQAKTVTMVLKADQKGKFCNPVVAAADRGLRDNAEHCVLVKGVAGLLIEVIDTVDPICALPGQAEQTVYQIRVTNQGSKDAEKIKLVFEVPAEEKYLSTTGPTAFKVSTSGGKTIVTYAPVEAIPVGGFVTYEVIVEAVKPGDARFRAIMTSEDSSLDRPVIEEESTHVYSGL